MSQLAITRILWFYFHSNSPSLPNLYEVFKSWCSFSTEYTFGLIILGFEWLSVLSHHSFTTPCSAFRLFKWFSFKVFQISFQCKVTFTLAVVTYVWNLIPEFGLVHDFSHLDRIRKSPCLWLVFLGLLTFSVYNVFFLFGDCDILRKDGEKWKQRVSRNINKERNQYKGVWGYVRPHSGTKSSCGVNKLGKPINNHSCTRHLIHQSGYKKITKNYFKKHSKVWKCYNFRKPEPKKFLWLGLFRFQSTARFVECNIIRSHEWLLPFPNIANAWPMDVESCPPLGKWWPCSKSTNILSAREKKSPG